MFKFLTRVGCLTILAAIGFLVIAFWSGGQKIREFGGKSGAFLQKGTKTLGDTADEIKGTYDAVKKKVDRWAGSERKGDK